MNKIIRYLPLCLVAAPAWALTSYVAPTKTLSKGGSEISLGADYFKTAHRVDENSEKVELSDGEGFDRIQGIFSGSYGLTDQLQVGVGALLRSQKSSYATTLNREDSTAQGLESTWIKLMYAFKPVDRLQYALEGVYRYKPYSNKELAVGETTDDLVLGDDGTSYSVGAGVTYQSVSKNYLTVRGGYNKPGQEISDEIYYQVEGALAWDRFALIAGVDGTYSLQRDPYKDDEANRIRFNTGSTFMYHQMNSERATAYIGANLAFANNWRAEVRASQTVAGKSTDVGTGFGFNLVRRVDKSDPIKKIDGSFKSYDIEGSIIQVSPKNGYVKIDKGMADEVEKGMVFDFFDFDYMGGNELIARGTVVRVQSDNSIIKITSRFKKNKPIKDGTLGRASFRRGR